MSLVGLLAVFALAIVIAVFFFGRESLTTVGARFMNALAHGDVDTLTKMSYVGNKPPEEMRKDWEFAVNTAGKYYNFSWKITSSAQADATNASIRLQVIRNLTNPGSYEENYQLPLIKVGDEWKVDVRGINREMYPALPR
ncbi:hypothetical protein [Fimbriimonas ginsengisoli]|uniref:DUF4878 domain-containing protein n=1 Tax=Fimbriimonas ginsengisoli Gsoil 348 TaxID=661478 RepID=A0A068NTS4_FIMGI|nr:hypothetical protein [Fimbriimonas ginsengisoli]AIE86150.1 hypothetical protein OP10G_2782 [Fimbriimonas ginsengisoli Gsoil 348]